MVDANITAEPLSSRHRHNGMFTSLFLHLFIYLFIYSPYLLDLASWTPFQVFDFPLVNRYDYTSFIKHNFIMGKKPEKNTVL